MKVLSSVTPTPEQLPIIQDAAPGTVLIRGAAGSGKTSTALLRLRQLHGFWVRRQRDGHIEGPLRIVVLTFNKTLRGYVEELAKRQLAEGGNVRLEIDTFARWAMKHLGSPDVLDEGAANSVICNFGLKMDLPQDFLLAEVEYVLGRFKPGDVASYAESGTVRTGRGRSPQMPVAVRQRLLDEVIRPYQRWKKGQEQFDWNDLAVELAVARNVPKNHVVIVDEAQDFSANQVRAILAHLAEEHSLTFVLDAAQRIYLPRHFTWREVGVAISPSRSHMLRANLRNTAEIAAFAAPLVEGLDLGDDGAIPDFSQCSKSGECMPIVLEGRYGGQVSAAIRLIKSRAKDDDSVAFLHPAGGEWFDYLRAELRGAGLPFVELSARRDWPKGKENIALSTMHSAKGLEFDHVFILGLSARLTKHGDEAGDSSLENHRRLLAMAIGRARKTVTLGYKKEEASTLMAFLKPSTYTLEQV